MASTAAKKQKAPSPPTSPKAKPTDTASTTSGTKRKRAPKESLTGNKNPRRSARSTTASKPTIDTTKLLQYLLSPSSADLCRPNHERDALAENSKLRAYTATIPLTPFEELLAAVILSRPIGHALGQRSFRYLINEPRNLRTPRAIRETEEEKVHQWLVEAKTQHKAKTAEQIINLANVCVERGWVAEGKEEDAELGGLRRVIRGGDEKMGKGNAQQRLKEVVKKEIKGMGETGTDIFLRRVQGTWGEIWPFVDKRTKGSLEKMGIPADAAGVQKLLEEKWDDLETKDLRGASEDEKRAYAFVLVLERAVGADLEGNVEEVLQAAEKA